MHGKFYFFDQECVILLTCTTTLILHNLTLEDFWILSPTPQVHFCWLLSLWIFQPFFSNQPLTFSLPTKFMRTFNFFCLGFCWFHWAFSPTLERLVLSLTLGWFMVKFIFLKFFFLVLFTVYPPYLVWTWPPYQIGDPSVNCLFVVATFMFNKCTLHFQCIFLIWMMPFIWLTNLCSMTSIFDHIFVFSLVSFHL